MPALVQSPPPEIASCPIISGRCSVSRPNASGSSSLSASSARPSRPSAVSFVMMGRWLTPHTSMSIARMSQSSSSDNWNVASVTSWHRPMVSIDVVDVIERVERGHRIGEVEEPRVGAELLHVARHADEHRDVAQRPVDPARADGVAHRLLDAVALGHGKVDRHARERTGGDAHDHVVGAREKFTAIGAGGARERCAREFVDVVDELAHTRQWCRVDVAQRDLGVGERPRLGDVEEQRWCPLVRPAADERDLRAQAGSLASCCDLAT